MMNERKRTSFSSKTETDFVQHNEFAERESSLQICSSRSLFRQHHFWHNAVLFLLHRPKVCSHCSPYFSGTLRVLAGVTNLHADEITNHAQPQIVSSLTQSSSSSPVLTLFNGEHGPQSIKSKSCFTPEQYKALWLLTLTCRTVATVQKTGIWRSWKWNSRDALFMSLIVLKHGQHWEVYDATTRFERKLIRGTYSAVQKSRRWLKMAVSENQQFPAHFLCLSPIRNGPKTQKTYVES